MNYTKYIYILAFGLLKFYVVSAQSTYFNRMIEYNKEAHFIPSVQYYDSSLFYMNAVIDTSGPSTSIYLTKTDLNGNRMWTKRFGSENNDLDFERCFSIKDSNLYFLYQETNVGKGYSNELYIKKLDLNGNELNEFKIILNDSVKVYNCKILEDGTFVNTGFRYVEKHTWYWFINRVDTNGNELFYKEYEWGGKNIGFTVDPAPDGGYVIGGKSRGYNPDSLDQSTIIKTDSVGNIEWIKDFGDKWIDYKAFSTVTDSGKIIASMILNLKGDNSWPWDGHHRNYIVCLNMEGDIVWDKYLGSSGRFTPNGTETVRQLKDGNIIFVGAEPDFYAGYIGYIHKMTPEGDSIWSRYYRYLKNTWTDHYLRDFTELPNGNLALSGFFDPFGDTVLGTSSNRMWILGVDSLGCLFPGCDTVCKKFKLEYTVTHDSGYTYHVEIKNPVVNSYALIYNGNYSNLVGSSSKLNFGITFPAPGKYTIELYGENKCVISSRADTIITVKEPLGINTGRKRCKIKLYPNPASGYIKVSIPHGTAVHRTYRLISLVGRVVRSGLLQGDGQISLSGVSRGMYQLLLYDEEGILIEQGKVLLE